MRIAYVSTDPGVPVFGRKGASVHVQEVVRALVLRGARVTLLCARTDGDPPPGLESVSVVRLPLPEGATPGQREVAAMARDRAVGQALCEAGPFDAVYERHALWSASPMEFARDANIPGILEVNAPLVQEQATYRALVHAPEAEETARRAFQAASAIFTVSAPVRAHIVAACPAASGRTVVVPNGVDAVRFSPAVRPAMPAVGEMFTVGFVGTLKPWHGLGALVDAFAALRRRHEPSRLLIVGDGPGRADLERDLAARGLREAALLTGPVDPAQVPALLTSMDVAVAPYPAMDDFYFSPLKLYEYMAAGRAIVASRIGQIDSVLRDGQTGLLVRPGDPADLAAALARLRDDVALRHTLGAAARAAAERDHTWDTVARRILGAAAGSVRAALAEAS